jgi:hypothetical protein
MKNKAIMIKAMEIVSELKTGADYRRFKGKKLIYKDRSLISIKLGVHYRLVYNEITRDASVYSHAEYNHLVGHSC